MGLIIRFQIILSTKFFIILMTEVNENLLLILGIKSKSNNPPSIKLELKTKIMGYVPTVSFTHL